MSLTKYCSPPESSMHYFMMFVMQQIYLAKQTNKQTIIIFLKQMNRLSAYTRILCPAFKLGLVQSKLTASVLLHYNKLD